jgi:hypothetical protein
MQLDAVRHLPEQHAVRILNRILQAPVGRLSVGNGPFQLVRRGLGFDAPDFG